MSPVSVNVARFYDVSISLANFVKIETSQFAFKITPKIQYKKLSLCLDDFIPLYLFIDDCPTSAQLFISNCHFIRFQQYDKILFVST